MGHIRAISQAHYCYWLSKDLGLFILDAMLHERLYSVESSLDYSIRAIEVRPLRSSPRAHAPRCRRLSPVIASPSSALSCALSCVCTRRLSRGGVLMYHIGLTAWLPTLRRAGARAKGAAWWRSKRRRKRAGRLACPRRPQGRCRE